MKAAQFLILLSIMVLPRSGSCQEAEGPIVARVLGEEIQRTPGMDGRQLMGEVLGALLDNYAVEHDLEPTEDEIDGFIQTLPSWAKEGGSDGRAVARQFIQAFKVNQSLYAEYGGRVLFQQAGPEPIDAYRDFLRDEPAELRAGRAEYADHKPVLDDFRTRAKASLGR